MIVTRSTIKIRWIDGSADLFTDPLFILMILTLDRGSRTKIKYKKVDLQDRPILYRRSYPTLAQDRGIER